MSVWRNDLGNEAREGKGTGEGVLYCGQRFAARGECGCGRCDGRCGPTNGCACDACRRLLASLLPPLFCAAGHTLRRSSARGLRGERGYESGAGFRCDSCKRLVAEPWAPVLHCRSCSFDICAPCAFAHVGEPPACAAGHPLAATTGAELAQRLPAYRTGYHCDACGHTWSPTSGGFPADERVMHCNACNYDLCATCAGPHAPPLPAEAKKPVVTPVVITPTGDLGEKTVRSALVIVPPKELWAQIQALRKEHDKAFVRWPPHINVLYPFVPEVAFPMARSIIMDAFKRVSRFHLTLAELGFFNFGKSCTMWTHPVPSPADSLKRLHTLLLSLFPHCTETSEKGEFTPHLTLGQFPGKSATEEMIVRTDWHPLEFVVEGVHLISRSGEDPFTIKHTIPFAAAEDDAAEEEHEAAPAPSEAPPVAKPPARPADIVEIDDNAESKSVARVERWIKRNAKKCLPTTRSKLCTAITPLCSTRFVVKPKAVEQYLVESGLVVIRGKTVSFPKIKLAPNELPRAPATDFPEVLSGVLERARAWCASQMAPPKTTQGLVNGLLQICRVKQPLSPSTIVDVLVKRGTIEFGANDTAHYNV